MGGTLDINLAPVYHDFAGRFPPAGLEAEPARIPTPSTRTHPKLITDTTLRDGAQDPRFALFPHETKLKYFDLLHELDNGTGRIEALEVFIYQKRDLWVLEKLLERGYEFPQVTTWTRALPKDIKLLVEVSAGTIKETGMLASASDHHILDKLGFASKQQAIEAYLAPIMTAVENGIRPRIHLEDATRADIDGWVIPFMHRVLKETDGQARFRVCDTIGWGLPDPHAAGPFGVPRLVSYLSEETGAELEFHGHNDFGLATANSAAAWIYGCKRVNTAFAGLGERTGNTSLEQMVAALVRLYGDPGFDLEALNEMARLIDTEVVALSAQAPLVGGGVFTTQAGIHQTGVSRQQAAPGGLIYLPYDPLTIGRDTVTLNRVGALSGMDGLVAVLNGEEERRSGKPGNFKVTSRVVKQLNDHVHASYDGQWDEALGKYLSPRTTFFEPGELLDLARSFEEAASRRTRHRDSNKTIPV